MTHVTMTNEWHRSEHIAKGVYHSSICGHCSAAKFIMTDRWGVVHGTIKEVK